MAMIASPPIHLLTDLLLWVDPLAALIKNVPIITLHFLAFYLAPSAQ
jgi:hypothetical protein